MFFFMIFGTKRGYPVPLKVKMIYIKKNSKNKYQIYDYQIIFFCVISYLINPNELLSIETSLCKKSLIFRRPDFSDF